MRIQELLSDEHREDHIARHGVTIDEVHDVAFGRHVVDRSRDGRLVVVGQTRGGRYLAVIIARRHGSIYALVTARDATDRERFRFRSRKG